jgi:tRNA (cytidine56-2'-O)-methyltransferase
VKLIILRLGHRPIRDKRVTTHIALVARAFGADGIIICGGKDSKIKEKILDIRERFGGEFSVEFGEKFSRILREWKEGGNEIIHLTVYGIPLPNVITEIQSSKKDKLIVVGGPKVPRRVYDIADYNVSITNQPHSEIAALAIFLDYFSGGNEFKLKFKNAQVEIIPDAKEKLMKEIKKLD